VAVDAEGEVGRGDYVRPKASHLKGGEVGGAWNKQLR